MALDALILLIALWALIRGYRRGFIFCLSRLLASLVAWIAAFSLSPFLASWFYRSDLATSLKWHLQGRVLPLIWSESSILDQTSIGDYQQGLLRVADQIGILGEQFMRSMEGFQDQLAHELTESVVARLSHYALKALAFFAIFFVVRALLAIFLKLLDRVFRYTPGLHLLNSLAGAALSLASLALILTLLALLFLGGGISFPGLQTQVQSSIILRYLYTFPLLRELFFFFYR